MQRAAPISEVSDLGADAAGIADTAEALAPADQARTASTAATASQSHVALKHGTDTLDALARLNTSELEAKFRDARSVADDLIALEGHPRGRVLTVPLLARLAQGRAGEWLRRYHASRFYPWEGKSFSTQDADTARGRNRVRYPSRRAMFPFRVSLGDSVVDGRPCIALDYDVPENPKLVRGMYGELRALSDGLYLGRSMRRRAKGMAPLLLLWFLIDTRQQDAALG
jgi:hypothetical protein